MKGEPAGWMPKAERPPSTANTSISESTQRSGCVVVNSHDAIGVLTRNVKPRQNRVWMLA
jgi:hypothetical protein